MKRKAVSFITACLLVISLLPLTALPVAAQATQITLDPTGGGSGNQRKYSWRGLYR